MSLRSIEKFDDLEFEQQCELLKANRMSWPVGDSDKVLLWDYLERSLPNSKPISTSHEINIGDTFVYTGKPRGTGMYVPKVGQLFKIESREAAIGMSIELIERGRGYEKVLTNLPHESI